MANSERKASPRLTKAPLVRVLTEVRWPELASFVPDTVANTLATCLANDYPFTNKINESQLLVTSDGVQQQNAGVVHRFTSVDEAWVVSLGKTFLSFETTKYTDCQDFIERFGVILAALVEAAQIPKWSRIGYRYTNRLLGDDLTSLAEFFDPSVLGGHGQGADDLQLIHAVQESLYAAETASLLVRSARLSSGGTIDPALPAVEGDNWILDLDAFEEARPLRDFVPENIASRAAQLSKVASDHFHRVTKPAFTKRFQ